MLAHLQQTILAVGLGIFIFFAVTYFAYMVGLIFVLKRLGRLNWMAFVPLLNYYSQIRAINAPPRWFLLSLPPYIGAVYVAAIAIRLGRVFNRGPAFSLTWLTLGAPVGMFIIARTRGPLNQAALDEPAGLVEAGKFKRKRRHSQAS